MLAPVPRSRDAARSNSTNEPVSNSDPDPPTSFNNKRSKVEESDEELFTVPDVEAQRAGAAIDSSFALSNSTAPTSDAAAAAAACNNTNQPEKRRRGRNPVDKEYRRLKRLLRNRVSAQQARERKKVYVSDLESRAKELQDRNAKLEEKISTLINENTMLRKVLMNTRPKADESNDFKQDLAAKS